MFLYKIRFIQNPKGRNQLNTNNHHSVVIVEYTMDGVPDVKNSVHGVLIVKLTISCVFIAEDILIGNFVNNMTDHNRVFA